jgi:transposase-like protein
MNIHKNAPWSPHGRADAVQRILEQRQPTTQVAAAFGVSERTMHKWLARFRAEGPPGLQDRSSRPHQVPGATPAVVVAQIERLRELVLSGDIGATTAVHLGFNGGGGDLERLRDGLAPQLLQQLRAMRADAVVLTGG